MSRPDLDNHEMAGRPDTPWISQVSRSLSFKQARVAVIVALILGMGFSIFQIVADLRNERQRIDITFEQSLKAFEDSAFRAAYGLDEDLARTVVRGLFQRPPFSRRKLSTTSVTEWPSLVGPSGKVLSNGSPINFSVKPRHM
jgi:hypothetical protein